MKNTCNNCKFSDQFGFCKKLVIDKKWVTVEDNKWVTVEDNKSIIAYYIDVREDENDNRTTFITSRNFSCNHYEIKMKILTREEKLDLILQFMNGQDDGNVYKKELVIPMSNKELDSFCETYKLIK